MKKKNLWMIFSLWVAALIFISVITVGLFLMLNRPHLLNDIIYAIMLVELVLPFAFFAIWILYDVIRELYQEVVCFLDDQRIRR